MTRSSWGENSDEQMPTNFPVLSAEKIILHSPHRRSWILYLVPPFSQQCSLFKPWHLCPLPLPPSSSQVLQEMALSNLCLDSFLIYQWLLVWGGGRSLILFPLCSSAQLVCHWQLHSELPSVSKPSEGPHKGWIRFHPYSSHSQIGYLLLEGNDNWLIASTSHLYLLIVACTLCLCGNRCVFTWIVEELCWDHLWVLPVVMVLKIGVMLSNVNWEKVSVGSVVAFNFMWMRVLMLGLHRFSLTVISCMSLNMF